MNKTAVFVTFAALAAIGIVGSVVLQIYRPDASANFTNLLVTVLGLSATAAGTFYGLGKANERIETVVKQTNGTLTAKDEEIKRLHAEKEELLERLAEHEPGRTTHHEHDE